MVRKALATSVAAYARGPVDQIPVFIPVFGYLDDFVIVSLGIWLGIRFMLLAILVEHRDMAKFLVPRPSNALAASIIADT